MEGYTCIRQYGNFRQIPKLCLHHTIQLSTKLFKPNRHYNKLVNYNLLKNSQDCKSL